MTPDSRQHPGLGQARRLSVSSGTDSELITPNDVASAGVAAFRAQSARTRSRCFHRILSCLPSDELLGRGAVLAPTAALQDPPGPGEA